MRAIKLYLKVLRCLALALLIGSVFGAGHLRAVAIVSAGTTGYNTDAPTSTDISNWTTGWGATVATGWDYVGQVGDASGVYLGSGWVITCGHVGPDDFTLEGTTYSVIAGSAVSIGTADLTMFQIATSPSLPSLTISNSAPNFGKSGVIVGFGNSSGRIKSWAKNTLAGTLPTAVIVGPYSTTDFYSTYSSSINPAQLVIGDSGGAFFVRDQTSGSWELAGLNEAYGTSPTDGSYAASYFVQLSTYKSSIQSVMSAAAVPEPTAFSLGAIFGLWALRRRR